MINKLPLPSQKTSSSIVENTLRIINGFNQYFFVLLILLLYFFRFHLDINEDHYMVLAKQFYNPDWVPASFTFNEFPGPRIFYEYFAGFLLSFLSFEMVSAIGKTLLCIGLAFPLVRIYKLLNLSNVDILLHLPILFLARQSYFGEELIMLSFETKGISYIFAFFAVYYILLDKYRQATIHLVISTYFHLLVGGWIMAYFLLYHLFFVKSFKKTFILGLAYSVSLIPFLIYLLPSLTGNFSPVESPVNLDWIYSYFLKPYHTAIWANTGFFLKGFLICTVFFVMCLFVFNQNEEKYNQKINLWNILIFAGTLLSVALAYFDKNGVFVKYFPWRINSLFVFLIYLQIVLLFKNFLLKEKLIPYFNFSILAFFVLVVFTRMGKHLAIDLYSFASGKTVEASYQDMANYISNNTDQKDVLLYLPERAEPDNHYSFDMETDAILRVNNINIKSI